MRLRRSGVPGYRYDVLVGGRLAGRVRRDGRRWDLCRPNGDHAWTFARVRDLRRHVELIAGSLGVYTEG